MNDDDTDTGRDDLIPVLPLSPREEAFCVHFADPESEHYGRSAASATAAGYASRPSHVAWRLRRRPRIVERIAEFQDLARAAAARVLAALDHERLLAVAKGDVASAIRASELQGKHLAMWVERTIVAAVVTEAKVYTQAEIVEAQRIATIRLEAGDVGELPDEAAVLETAKAELEPADREGSEE